MKGKIKMDKKDITEFQIKKNQFDLERYKKLVHFRLIELQRCLEETIILDKDK